MWIKKTSLIIFLLLFITKFAYGFIFFSDDMNSILSENNWQSGGINNEWGRGAKFGEICWATDIDGWYGKNSDQWLRTKNPINLTNALSVQLSYNSLLYLASGDYTFLEISTDLITWDTILSYSSKDAHHYWKFIGPINLSSYAGDEIYLRYRLVSDDVGYSYGWYIDDVLVEGKLVSEPFTIFTVVLGCFILFVKKVGRA